MNEFNLDINPKNYFGIALDLEKEKPSENLLHEYDAKILQDKTKETLKKYQTQRTEQGFDDSELIDLDLTIVKFALPRIQRFLEIEEKEFLNFEQDNSQIQYFKDLRQIISDLENYNHDTTDLTLFFKYFKQLWY